MIIILGVRYSSFKNQGDNSHFQCIVSMIGIDCLVESDTVLSFKTQLDKYLSERRFDLDHIY